MELIDAILLSIGTLAALAALVAAFFAWRDWERGRQLWEITFELQRFSKREGEMQRDDALRLNVIVRCRRNAIRVEDVVLRRNARAEPLRHRGTTPALGPPKQLSDGQSVRGSFPSDTVAPYHRRRPDGPLREACWIDAEGNYHCSPLSAEDLGALLNDSRL